MEVRHAKASLFAVILMGLLIIGSFSNTIGDVKAQDPEVILKAAVQDEMKTRNILNSNDVWTSHVLWNCYEGVIQGDPNTLDPVPYILVGFEQDGTPGITGNDRTLPPYNTGFLPQPLHDQIHPELLADTEANPGMHEIIAYYDFTDVLFHDGVQVDIMDIIFSYYILALHPNWYTGLAPLMDDGGLTGNFTASDETGRWLGIWDVSDTYSNDGNSLTSALSFHMSDNYAQVWIDTMSVPLFPQHIWEGTGGGIHNDFGYAIDSYGYGVPKNDPTLEAFDLLTKAMDWEPNNNEVIGTGMFKFKEFIPGSHSKILTNEDYLEMETGGLSIHVPYIDGIEFIRFSTPQQATMGLKKGEADIILWSVPPDFIPELQSDPNVAITSNPEPGFFYLAFNMRTSMFGYPGNDPSQGDWGKPLRQAIAHLIDKKTIVDYYLQGYGIIADGPVSPLSTFWYNSTLAKYDFNVELAKSKLDAAGLVDTDGDGWRDTDAYNPGDQDEILTLMAPNPDYDPIRAQACLLIETHMKEAGINVFCSHQAFGTIIDAIDRRDFQLYILGWAIGGSDPDYLYSFFYSLNAERGQNYPGYQSQPFDTVILESRSEMELSTRQDLIREAQGILVDDLPYNVLYYRKNIEAYRLDRFTGWTTTARGSIFNYWSIMNIKQPSDKFLRTTVTVASAVQSNQTEAITVTVRDQDRNQVQGATVNITVEDGNLTVGGGDYGRSWEGSSNVNGQVSPNFKAPYIPLTNETEVNGSKVSITVIATKDGYDDSGIKSVFTTVFPVGVEFISVTITLSFGDLIDEEESTEMEIEAKDQDGNEIDGVEINITALPTDLDIEPNSGTTANGGKLENIVLTAPKVDSDMAYVIKATPNKEGAKGVHREVELTVLDIPAPPVTPGFDILTVIAVISIAAVSYAIFVAKRKRR